jgi:hypothetical protein
MTAYLRRAGPAASPGAVIRAMRALRLVGARRDTKFRTTVPAKDGRRAGVTTVCDSPMPQLSGGLRRRRAFPA